MDLPAGWLLYRGADGLLVQHPRGWQVEEHEGGTFLVHRVTQDPAAVAMVYVRPMRFDKRDAKKTARMLPQLIPDVFEGVEITRVEQLQSPADVALAHVRFTARGQRNQGNVLVFNRGGSGMLFGISSTEANWAADAPVLTRILTGFWYAPKAQQTHAALPEMVTWRDPNEGAFTLPVPKGWRIEGGLKRPSVLMWRPEVVATSPDDSIHLRLGDGSLEGLYTLPYALPLPGVNMEGMRANVYGGMYLRYLPGYEFLTQFYLPRRFASISGVQVQALPEVAAAVQAQDPVPPPMQSRADAGAVSFDVDLPGGRYRGYYAAATRLFTFGGTTIWLVESGLFGYVCRPEREAAANAILGAMLQGFRFDSRWRAVQAQADARTGETIRQNVSEMNDITWRNLQQRSAAMDHSYQPTERWSRGEAVIRDPQTHEEYRVPSGYREYYRIGQSERSVGVDAPNSPDLPEYWFPRMEIAR